MTAATVEAESDQQQVTAEDHAEVAPAGGRRGERADVGVLGWCVAVCGAFGVAAWRHRWLHEDGLINLRIVDQILLGNGAVFNAGERVEAFTSPAQIAVLVLARTITVGSVPVETLVFVIGVGAAVGGLWCAMVGAARLWGPQPLGSLRWLPVGAAAFAAVPATWDFATSGHEGGLAYLWIGASLLVIATRVDQIRSGAVLPVDRPRAVLVLLGSGALVRPELVIYSAAFGVCWWLFHRGAPGSRWRAAGWAASLLAVSEVLRMGYYGSLLPNTALAKLGGGLEIGRGGEYLSDFVRPYALQLAIPLLVFTLLPVLRGARRAERMVLAAFAVPSLLVLAQLVAIGGDYINGRLIVAPLFGLLAPVAVVPFAAIWTEAPAARARRAALGVLALWMLLAAFVLRPPWNPRGHDILNPRLDARELGIARFADGSPLTEVTDYDRTFLAGPYHQYAMTADRTDGPLLWVDDPWAHQAVPLAAGSPPTIASGAIGALGMISGPHIRIIDRTALADPVASRLPVVQHTPGHLRYLPVPWVYARAGVANDPASRAAARALGCGALRDVVDSATGPLTPRRFVENVLRAPRNTFVQVPSDPEEAVDAFC